MTRPALALLLPLLTLPACDNSTLPPLPDFGTAGGDGAISGDGSAGECGPAPAPMPGVVMTDRGAVKGAQAGTTWAFKGIPYAAPPTGALRFKPPVEHACYGGTLDAGRFGNACLQLDTNGNVVGDEDCLTLNVWTPQPQPASPLPVLFFIHGGGNIQGSSSEQSSGTYLYDGQPIVEASGAIVVTINYRLGLFGFFALPALDAESDHHVSGNYGLLDQIAALSWVKRNIAAFGGDPARVMIFGESAGGLDTCMLMVTPQSDGLFSRALIESGGCPGPTLAQAEMQDTALLPMVSCDKAPDVAACLRAIPGAMLVKSLPGVVSVSGLDSGTKYGPNVDGYVLPAAPMQLLRSGMQHHVPFTIGVNAEETSRSVPAIPSVMVYENAVHMVFGQALGDQVLAVYPAANYPTPRAAMVALTTEARFLCPSRQIARAVAGSQSEKVYRYLFKHALDSGPLKPFGAWHGLELLFVFGHVGIAGYLPSDGEKALSSAMIGYWSRFAAAGDPNDNKVSVWPAYDIATDPYLVLDDTIASGMGLRTAHCDFWDKLSP